MKNFDYIPYGRPNLDDHDASAVLSVLQSPFLTQGPVVPKFESSFSGYCGAKYAIAVNSATSALHIACKALDVSDEDIVWTSPISFAASANAALLCGAQVDFVDIDKHTFNICVEHLRQRLNDASRKNQLPKVLIPVHMAGQSAQMQEIYELSLEFGFKIIEDASHAVGADYQGAKVGSCKFSDITIFSFHPVKIITSGEGGIAVTNNKKLMETMRLLRSHGITRDPMQLLVKNKPDWYYEQHCLGYNYRMTDISAALGLSQLAKVDSFVELRNKIAKKYDQCLSGSVYITPQVQQSCKSSFHLYIIHCPNMAERKYRDELFLHMRENKVGVNLHYFPIYNHPYFRNLNVDFAHCQNADAYADTALSLPIHPGLTEGDVETVINILKKFI